MRVKLEAVALKVRLWHEIPKKHFIQKCMQNFLFNVHACLCVSALVKELPRLRELDMFGASCAERIAIIYTAVNEYFINTYSALEYSDMTFRRVCSISYGWKKSGRKCLCLFDARYPTFHTNQHDRTYSTLLTGNEFLHVIVFSKKVAFNWLRNSALNQEESTAVPNAYVLTGQTWHLRNVKWWT